MCVASSPALVVFLSTSSARRTTRIRMLHACAVRISIHVLREEDDASGLRLPVWIDISIHVLREEDDR